MIRTGLVSVTFRPLSPAQVIALVIEGKLDAIEWGGDIHVPHGDLEQARSVRTMTRDAGIAIAAYGSYYRAGVVDQMPFEKILDTAIALGAPSIRVWAGILGSQESDTSIREKVADTIRTIADTAAAAHVTVAIECHGGTLTDTAESAEALLRAVNHPNARCYWQPPVDLPVAGRLDGIARIAPWLGNIHVFHWPAQNQRAPLADGEKEWAAYFRAIAAIPGDRCAMLEFVKDNSSAQFIDDAATLRHLAQSSHHHPD